MLGSVWPPPSVIKFHKQASKITGDIYDPYPNQDGCCSSNFMSPRHVWCAPSISSFETGVFGDTTIKFPSIPQRYPHGFSLQYPQYQHPFKISRRPPPSGNPACHICCHHFSNLRVVKILQNTLQQLENNWRKVHQLLAHWESSTVSKHASIVHSHL